MTSKGKVYNVTLIPGDGIGPEVTSAARKVIAAAGVIIDWEIMDAGQVQLISMVQLCQTKQLNR